MAMAEGVLKASLWAFLFLTTKKAISAAAIKMKRAPTTTPTIPPTPKLPKSEEAEELGLWGGRVLATPSVVVAVAVAEGCCAAVVGGCCWDVVVFGSLLSWEELHWW